MVLSHGWSRSRSGSWLSFQTWGSHSFENGLGSGSWVSFVLSVLFDRVLFPGLGHGTGHRASGDCHGCRRHHFCLNSCHQSTLHCFLDKEFYLYCILDAAFQPRWISRCRTSSLSRSLRSLCYTRSMSLGLLRTPGHLSHSLARDHSSDLGLPGRLWRSRRGNL